MQQVPKTWESRTLSSGCPSVAGQYENKGEDASGSKPSLASLLEEAIGADRGLDQQSRSKLSLALRNANTVALSLAGDEDVEIIVSSDAVIARWVLSKDKFSCANGVMSIQKSASFGGDNVGMVRNVVLDIQRSERYLMLNSHGGGAGFILFVPVVGYESIWSRFPAVKAP